MRARRLAMGCKIVEWNVETRQSRNLGDTSQTHFLGAGRYDNKHGVGIWWTRSGGKELQKIHTHCWRCSQRRIGSRIRCWAYTCWPAHTQWRKQTGDWMKHWLMMLQDYTALNTMYRKTPQKQTTFISPKGNEKQIDYILTKRRYLRQKKDAEANDMIHMGSGHRCVMATFTITTLGKNGHYKTIKENTK